MLRKSRSLDASWDWRGHALPQGGGPPRGGDRHASPPTGDPRGAKGLPRGRGLGCASGREPRVWREPGAPGEVGRPRMIAHTPEANRTDALQGATKEEGTLRRRRRRRGGKRHEKLATALVDGTTRLDSKGVESFTLVLFPERPSFSPSPKQPPPRRHLPWRRLSHKYPTGRDHMWQRH